MAEAAEIAKPRATVSVQAPGEQIVQRALGLLHAAAQCVVHTIFQQLEAATDEVAAQKGKKDLEDDEDDEENMALIMSQGGNSIEKKLVSI